jgi:nucleotide-binding universal stress UspA family protein
MNPSRIMVGLDDSPAALAGARFAVALAAGLDARVRFVHVSGNGELTRTLTALHPGRDIEPRRSRGAEDLLAHMVTAAAESGVVADSEHLRGEPARLLLDQAREWGADLVVLGHSDRTGPGRLPVGRVTRHALEFCECPVTVVPAPGSRSRRIR